MKNKLDGVLSRFNKEKFAAGFAIVSLMIIMAIVFLCYIQSMQVKNITNHLAQETQKSLLYIMDNQIDKYKKILLPLESMQSMDEVTAFFLLLKGKTCCLSDIIYYDKAGKYLFNLSTKKNSNNLNADELEVVGDTTQNYGYFGNSFKENVFKIFYETQNDEIVAVEFDLTVIIERVNLITGNKNYFIESLDDMNFVHEFDKYRFITPIDSFLAAFIKTPSSNGLCMDEYFIVEDANVQKSYLVSLVTINDDLHMIAFKDVTEFIENKNEILYTAIVGIIGFLLFVISLFFSYINIYHKRIQQLVEQNITTIRNERNRFKQYYRYSPVPILALNKQRVIVHANDKWLEYVGYSHDEVIGGGFSRFCCDFTISRNKKSF